MNFKKYVFQAMTFSMLISNITFAQSAAQSATQSTTQSTMGTSTVQIKPPVKADDKPLSVSLGLEMSESILKEENAPKENSVSMLIAPVYKINDTFKASAKVILNQDNFGQHETTASDVTLGLGIKGYKINESLKTTHSLGTIAPLSQNSVIRDRLKSQLSVSNGIAFSGNYFDLTYKLSLARNFHEYTQNAVGSANIEYRVSQLLDLKIPVTENFYLTSQGTYRIGSTYQGFNRYSFIFDADMNYDITQKLAANIGTSNDGSALKSNGTDSNISAYNENTSVVRAGISYEY